MNKHKDKIIDCAVGILGSMAVFGTLLAIAINIY